MQSVTSNSAAWRISLLNNSSLDEIPLSKISQPVLVVASEADRLLPSVNEADRLFRYLPNATKILLLKSGHARLLEKEIQLEKILVSVC